jgi:hypothetical protein
VLVYAIAIVVALAIPLATRGSYGRLLAVRWRYGSVLFLGLAIQIALEFVTIPREHWHDVGFGLLVASYVLILAFAARNLVIRGMGIVFIGIACNALVITVNQGMPFKVPVEWRNESWTKPTVKHHLQQSGDKLRFLSDIIVVKEPFDSVLSFGDLILAVGLCDVAYNVSRKPKRRRPSPSGRADEADRSDAPAASSPSSVGSSRSGSIDLTDERDDQELALTRSRSTRSRATTTRSS